VVNTHSKQQWAVGSGGLGLGWTRRRYTEQHQQHMRCEEVMRRSGVVLMGNKIMDHDYPL